MNAAKTVKIVSALAMVVGIVAGLWLQSEHVFALAPSAVVGLGFLGFIVGRFME